MSRHLHKPWRSTLTTIFCQHSTPAVTPQASTQYPSWQPRPANGHQRRRVKSHDGYRTQGLSADHLLLGLSGGGEAETLLHLPDSPMALQRGVHNTSNNDIMTTKRPKNACLLGGRRQTSVSPIITRPMILILRNRHDTIRLLFFMTLLFSIIISSSLRHFLIHAAFYVLFFLHAGTSMESLVAGLGGMT